MTRFTAYQLIAYEIFYSFPFNSSLFCEFIILFDCIIAFEQFIGPIWSWCHLGANLDNTKVKRCQPRQNEANRCKPRWKRKQKKSKGFYLLALQHLTTLSYLLHEWPNSAVLQSYDAHACPSMSQHRALSINPSISR